MTRTATLKRARRKLKPVRSKLTVQQRIAAMRRRGWTDEEIGNKLDVQDREVGLIMLFRPVQRRRS